MSAFIGQLFSSFQPPRIGMDDMMQGVASIGAGLTAIYRSKAEAAALNTQAMAHEVEAAQRRLQGAQEARQLTERLYRDLAAARVGFAASGADISRGTTALVLGQAADRGMEDVRLARDTRLFQARNLQRRARRKRLAASLAKDAGWAELFGSVADFTGDLARRG